MTSFRSLRELVRWAGFAFAVIGYLLLAPRSEAGPAFTIRLQDQTAILGQTVVFTTAVSGDVPGEVTTLQWFKDGLALAGQNQATLTLPKVQFSDAGAYHCTAFNVAGDAMSTVAQLTVIPVPVGPFGRVINASVRTTLNANQSLVVGFTVQGGAKPVLVRGVGPSLAKFDVFNFMPDPSVSVYRGNTPIATNDNWNDDAALATSFLGVGAFAFLPASQDAAVMSLVEGGHTAVLSGPGGGNALLEMYDAGGDGAARLINVSARSHVGADALILGVVITGSAPQPLLVRAIGPSLAAFGVTGTLADPKLAVYNAAGAKIGENDQWRPELAAQFAQAGAFQLENGTKDSALVVTLPAGSYTFQITGVAGATGEALVELYELPYQTP